ncbi:MAG: tetratricopeptide repeat protein [Flavobacteriales bacterium]|nr:tetratricopeptide repeat protein [Flavobacteriales bacterium]
MLVSTHLLWALLLAGTLVAQSPRQDSLRAVAADGGMADSLRMRAMDRLAWSYMYSEPDSARMWAERELALARERKARAPEGDALNTLGTVSLVRSRFDEALLHYEAALAIREELDDLRGIASTLGNIGLVHKQRGDLSRALEYQLKGLTIEERRGNPAGQASSLNNIGNIHISLGDHQRALEHHRRALDIYERLNDSSAMGRSLGNVGLALYRLGNWDDALDHQWRSLAIRRALDDKRGMAIALFNIAKVQEDQGDRAAALRHHTEAMELERQLGNRQGEAQSLVAIADLHLIMGRATQARSEAEQAVAIARDIGDRETLKGAEHVLYRLHRAAGRMGEALRHYERFVQLRDSTMGEEKRQEIARQETRYEYEKKIFADSLSNAAEQQVKDLRIAEQQANIRTQRYGLIAIGVGLVLLAALAWSIRRGKRLSDELLLNILPAETAAELKSRGSSEARLFDEVTVLFTDFKGFTEISERMPPKDLVAMIDECFRAFDDIVGRHAVEKIKTIGDAYMAVGGLPTPSATHARDVVRAALAIRDWMVDFQQRREALGLLAPAIRIGVHTGPVVAGIVGVKKFQYDIWGDTVNTASRMESNGETGQVNISEATCDALRGAYRCRDRGHVRVKGKGELRMFVVEGAA